MAPVLTVCCQADVKIEIYLLHSCCISLLHHKIYWTTTTSNSMYKQYLFFLLSPPLSLHAPMRWLHCGHECHVHAPLDCDDDIVIINTARA